MPAPPQLTWNMVGPIAFASATHPGTAITKQEYMSCVISLFKSSSYWTVTNIDTTGSLYEAVIVGPRTGSNTQQRVLFTANATGSNSFFAPRAGASADSIPVGRMMIGLAPSGGLGTYVNGRFLSDFPFGSSTRWSKYWSMGALSNTTTEFGFLIESADCFFFGAKGRVSSVYGALIGGIGYSLDSGSGETNSIVYGMSATGDVIVNNTFFSAGTNFLGTSTGDDTPHTGFFIVSGGIANAMPSPTGSNSNYFEVATIAQSFQLVGPADSSRGQTITSEETLQGLPIFMVSNQTPYRAICVLRQVYAIGDYVSLATVVSGVNPQVILGYTLGSSQVTQNDCVLFGNT